MCDAIGIERQVRRAHRGPTHPIFAQWRVRKRTASATPQGQRP